MYTRVNALACYRAQRMLLEVVRAHMGKGGVHIKWDSLTCFAISCRVPFSGAKSRNKTLWSLGEREGIGVVMKPVHDDSSLFCS